MDGYEDPMTEPFWSAAREHRFLVQRCDACGRHQFYPRSLCAACGSTGVRWEEAGGAGRVYAVTTVRVQVIEERTPPYQVALVELDEGPRVLTTISGEAVAVGDRVRLEWEERASLPPLPIFARA